MSIIVIGDTVPRGIAFNPDWHDSPSDPSLTSSAGARVIRSFSCEGNAESGVIVAVSKFE